MESRSAAKRQESRWRRNWARSWRLGPVEFEIEWVPKASQFGFYLSFDFSGGRYA